MTKTNAGHFFEDFALGQILAHATPRTAAAGDRALYLALISLLPTFLMKWLNVPFYFGGIALLIVVQVSLETVRQIESHLLMRNYEGFMKKSAPKKR